jgi:hypothetical protein
MKKLTLLCLLMPLVALAGETQPECISRVKRSMQACGEVCDQVMDTKKGADKCVLECGKDAREKLIDECHVPLKR